MPKKFDVAIIGSSLGGAAAAHYLGRAGLSIALIDKASFPRRKPCGEGLSSYGLTQLKTLGLEEHIKSLPHLRYSGYRVKTSRNTVNMKSPWGSGVTVQRSLLDKAVVDAALTNPGVTGFFSEEVLKVKAHEVTLKTATLVADFIIIADGSNSPLANQLGCTTRRVGPSRMGVTATFRGAFSVVPQVITILIKKNYEIYCTPLAGSRLNISILAAETAPLNIREILLSESVQSEVFDETSFVGELELPPMGRVGIGNVRRECRMPSVFLVGDAKEAFDPIAGMGMSHALRSGILAAEAIIRSRGIASGGRTIELGISRWHEQQQVKCVRPMRLFTNLCYRTFMVAEKYPFLLGAATSTLSTLLLKNITKELSS